MTAEANPEKRVRYDRGVKPVEVVIPYDEGKQTIREAEDDRRSGNKEAFISLDELEKELSI